MPKFPAHFTGTGDLFAALLLASMHRHPNDLKARLIFPYVATLYCQNDKHILRMFSYGKENKFLEVIIQQTYASVINL